MNTKPIPREKHLGLENMSLKLHIMRRNVQDFEVRLKAMAKDIFDSEGLDPKQWEIDLDRGVFVEKETK